MLFKRLFTTSNPRLSYFPATRELDPKKLEFSPMQRRFEKYSSPYATAYPRAEAIPNSAPERRPYERIVAVRKLVRLSAKGKHMRFDSWCLAGDRNGSVGLAHATSTQASKATNLAMRRARNTMKHFELFEGRTLYHDIEFEFHGMRIRLMPKPKGYSVRAQRDIYEFCMSLGIKDLAAQIMVGSTNPMTISKAMMYALTYLHKKPSDVARLRVSFKCEMFAQIPKAESDPIFALNAAYKADTNPKKVNLGIGAYRTNEGVPWVLPSVQKAEQKILDMKLDHEYLPIEGLQRFTDSAARLMLGSFASEGKHSAVQSISGTGGVRYGAELLNRFPPKAGKVVYISKPTWGNHKNIFQDAGFEVREYKYWNASTNGLDLAGMLNDIKSAPEGSVILLHACAHNPTGVDPTEDQWNQILAVIRDKNHLTFFDSAYQGFASGNVDKDAFSVRLWCKEQVPFVLAMSFSKNFGLYNERCGVTIVYCPGANGKVEAENVRSQLARIARPMISNPPAHGARIVDIVLNSDELHKEWLDNIKTMSERIIKMRKALFDVLVQKQTPGTWNHITDQIGMFSYTGLTKEQCKCLIEKFHIYLVDNGRISMAGINEGNVEYVGNAIDYAVRTYPSKL